MKYHHPNADDSSSSSSLPLRPKHHHTICFPSCFRPSAAVDGGGPDSPAAVTPASQAHSSSTCFLSKAQELPDLRGKYRGLASRAGRRRNRSADFGYDPLSYALNFDEGAEGETLAAGEELRYRSFSSRLPASPMRVAVGDRERALKGIGKGREASL